MAEVRLMPNAIDTSISSYDSTDDNYPFSNVYDKDETNETFVRYYMVTGSIGITRLFFSFDTSCIPQKATITSVSCTAKARMQNSSVIYAGNNVIALCENSTSVSTSESTTVYGTSASTATISSTGFTRQMLDNLRFKFQGSRGFFGTSTSYYMDFFGCSLTVTYTVNGDEFYFKTGSGWKMGTSIYKKVDGVWVLQDTYNDTFDKDKTYVLIKD